MTIDLTFGSLPSLSLSFLSNEMFLRIEIQYMSTVFIWKYKEFLLSDSSITKIQFLLCLTQNRSKTVSANAVTVSQCRRLPTYHRSSSVNHQISMKTRRGATGLTDLSFSSRVSAMQWVSEMSGASLILSTGMAEVCPLL